MKKLETEYLGNQTIVIHKFKTNPSERVFEKVKMVEFTSPETVVLSADELQALSTMPDDIFNATLNAKAVFLGSEIIIPKIESSMKLNDFNSARKSNEQEIFRIHENAVIDLLEKLELSWRQRTDKTLAGKQLAKCSYDLFLTIKTIKKKLIVIDKDLFKNLEES